MHSAEEEPPGFRLTPLACGPRRGRDLGVARHHWAHFVKRAAGAQTSSANASHGGCPATPQAAERPFSQNGEREGRERPSEFSSAPEDSEGQLATRRAGARPGEEAAVAPATAGENEGGRGLGGIAAPRVSRCRKDRGRARARREVSARGERDRSGPSTPVPMPLSRLLLAVLK